jgi:hypothetical protein
MFDVCFAEKGDDVIFQRETYEPIMMSGTSGFKRWSPICKKEKQEKY